ncbi:hypothetical protein [Streptococcus sp. zg-JUN1979]|uniref:hypothetical protein n=1 Tax=Streptococcus sp. zg-JUN1979 TaxID=3391450 RepID=UPI0039A62CBC
MSLTEKELQNHIGLEILDIVKTMMRSDSSSTGKATLYYQGRSFKVHISEINEGI